MTQDNSKPARRKVMFGDASLPPGGIKIAQALRTLLEKKSFDQITTAEIAATSGMTEALIYKHFGSKRELLFCLLIEFHNTHYANILAKLEGVEGAVSKLRRVIWEEVNIYERDRVYGRLLICELGAIPGFYESAAFNKLRQEYAGLIREIIEEGVRAGEIRDDVSEWAIRQSLLGAIRFMCLPLIVFGRDIDTDAVTKDICAIVFDGIRKKS